MLGWTALLAGCAGREAGRGFRGKCTTRALRMIPELAKRRNRIHVCSGVFTGCMRVSGALSGCRRARAQVKKDQPDLTFGEVGKELGKQWKEADEKTKEKYAAMAKKEKERADKEIAAYKAKKEGEAPAAAAKDEDDADEDEEDEAADEEDEDE